MADTLTFVQPQITIRREKTWTLDGTKLAWSTSKDRGETPLASITGIKVRYTPSVQAGLPATRECLIDIAGQKRQTVVIQEYGLASDAAVSASYAAFVRDLMARAVAQNPSVVLSAGNTWVKIMWIVIFAGLIGGALFFAFSLLTTEFDYRILLVAMLLASMAYPIWRQIQVASETTFDLATIPAEIVGA